MNPNLRRDADQIITASLAAVQPDAAVRRALTDFHAEGRVVLVAVGKAGEVIEALEMPGDRFLVCLQWHPEKTLGMDEYSILPFQALRKAIDENR